MCRSKGYTARKLSLYKEYAMQRTLIIEALAATAPQPSITICGWIRTRRDAKEFSFVEVNDGSCLGNMQCIVDAGTTAQQQLADAATGAAISVTGELVASPGKGQQWEIRAHSVTVFGLADPETFPLQKKRHSDEFLRTIAHLRSRTNKFGAAFRIRSEAGQAVHQFFQGRRFSWVHTPVLTGADCEGAGEMFRVTSLEPGNKDMAADFFGRQCNLTVSGQLEAEALAMGLGRVYTFGPTFRAENSNTPRHAAEFVMIEPELAFCELPDLMDFAEDFVRSCVDEVLSTCPEELALFDRWVEPGLIDSLKTVAGENFARITYREAISILQKSGKNFEYPVSYGIDLQTEHERYLSEEHFKKPTMVTDYPRNIKAFYMRANDDGDTVAAMDLLVPRIGELIGGSQREERYDLLRDRILAMGQEASSYDWYLDLRRFGSVPHSGFGMGFERFIMMLTGVSNIRDVIPFPRTPGSLEF